MPKISVARAGVLDQLAVHALLDAQIGGVELGDGDDARPHRAEAVEALAAEPLTVAELRLAGADVVGAGVAVDDGGDLVCGDPAAPGAPMTTASSASASTWPIPRGSTIGSPRRSSVLANLPKSSGALGGSKPDSSRVVGVVEADADDLRLAAAVPVAPLRADLAVRHAHLSARWAGLREPRRRRGGAARHLANARGAPRG